ncbi:MAG: glycosyltransferase family 4 protein [Kiritimatiellae bacterium]|nr:glycosyltransferase family 4 protein [Kiritimatiellia bacterium]
MKDPVILQVLPALEMGGVERGTVEIATALQAAGIRNYVASAGGRLVSELEKIGVRHIQLPLATKSPFRICRNSLRLAQLARELGVTLFHVRSRAPAWSVLFASRKTGIPFLATYHGVYGTKPAWLKKRYNAVMLKGVKVIAVSDFVRNHIESVYGVESSRIVRIHRGADTDYFNPEKIPAARIPKIKAEYGIAPETPVVTLVGRLTGWKGQKLLLDAFTRMTHRNFACLLVGSDQGRTEYTRELEEQIAQLPSGISVRIIQSSPDMAETYAMSDIVVNASTQPEAFGRVIPEAQAMQRLTLGSAHGGACETIDDGKTGFLFTPGDADDLARQLDRMLDLSPEECRRIRESARASVLANFSTRQLCEKTLALYRELHR